MAERSKRVLFKVDKDKLNSESLKLLKKYKIDLSIKELSERTIYGYETDLIAWFSYIYIFQGNKSVIEIDEDDLTEYFYYRKLEGNNTRRLKRIMSSISALFIYLRKKRITKENPMEYIDRPRKDNNVVEQTFLTQEQVDKVILELERDRNKNLRVLTYFALGLSTMARVNALSNIKWSQINFDVMVITGSVEKEGYVVDFDFDEYCKELLLELKAKNELNGVNSDFVFATKYNGIYNCPDNATCNNWCKKIGEIIDVPSLHNHDLRHSGATIMKNNGAKLEDISKLLNHMSTDVTLKFYIKSDNTKLKESKAKFGALRNNINTSDAVTIES